MDDLISRQAAIDAINSIDNLDAKARGGIYFKLMGLPSAQPERKRGCWVGIDDEPCDVYECDQCGTTYDTVDNTWDLPYFCPNCGADMRGEKDV